MAILTIDHCIEGLNNVLPVRNEQICNRSVLTKTDQLQITLSSAESVFSLLQTLSLNTLREDCRRKTD